MLFWRWVKLSWGLSHRQLIETGWNGDYAKVFAVIGRNSRRRTSIYSGIFIKVWLVLGRAHALDDLQPALPDSWVSWRSKVCMSKKSRSCESLFSSLVFLDPSRPSCLTGEDLVAIMAVCSTLGLEPWWHLLTISCIRAGRHHDVCTCRATFYGKGQPQYAPSVCTYMYIVSSNSHQRMMMIK